MASSDKRQKSTKMNPDKGLQKNLHDDGLMLQDEGKLNEKWNMYFWRFWTFLQHTDQNIVVSPNLSTVNETADDENSKFIHAYDDDIGDIGSWTLEKLNACSWTTLRDLIKKHGLPSRCSRKEGPGPKYLMEKQSMFF